MPMFSRERAQRKLRSGGAKEWERDGCSPLGAPARSLALRSLCSFVANPFRGPGGRSLGPPGGTPRLHGRRGRLPPRCKCRAGRCFGGSNCCLPGTAVANRRHADANHRHGCLVRVRGGLVPRPTRCRCWRRCCRRDRSSSCGRTRPSVCPGARRCGRRSSRVALGGGLRGGRRCDIGRRSSARC